jgi:hypothetical protein
VGDVTKVTFCRMAVIADGTSVGIAAVQQHLSVLQQHRSCHDCIVADSCQVISSELSKFVA